MALPPKNNVRRRFHRKETEYWKKKILRSPIGGDKLDRKGVLGGRPCRLSTLSSSKTKEIRPSEEDSNQKKGGEEEKGNYANLFKERHEKARAGASIIKRAIFRQYTMKRRRNEEKI